jgi:U3 small nucleolar RNA-associated protein 24
LSTRLALHHPFCMAKTQKKAKAKAYAATKRMISPHDSRITKPAKVAQVEAKQQQQRQRQQEQNHVTNAPSSLFFTHNTSLGPPYHVLIDTNFINFSIQNKLDIMRSLMDVLYAKVVVCITEAVMAELEKLGPKYRVALRIAKDPRFTRLPAMKAGATYADDDLVERVTAHRIYIVATCDKELKRRLRKIPGVPMISIKARRYQVERMPEAQH